MSTYLKDLLERVFWTALEAGIGVISVDQLDWAKGWAVVIAFAIAVIKGVVAKHLGNPESASTVKGV